MPFFANRLTIARRRLGWTKQQLATEAKLGYRSVVAYERSETEPESEGLARMAQATGFPVLFFCTSDLEIGSSDGVSFRSLARMTASQRDRALASRDLGVELLNWVEQRFTLQPPDVPDLRAYGSPEAAAQALRVRWTLADKPIPNMLWLLESKGVRVFSLAEENTELDAFSFRRDKQPFIFLNTVKSAEHSRFDAAHELGHLVLHQHGAAVGRDAENEANRFASAFLMPETSVQNHAPVMPTLYALIEAKHYWKVSVAALAHRLHAIHMLSKWTYHSLCVEIQMLGYRRSEPDPEPREVSQVWPKVFAELRKDGLTHRHVAETLNWPVKELQALVFQLILSEGEGGDRSRVGPTDAPKLRLV